MRHREKNNEEVAQRTLDGTTLRDFVRKSEFKTIDDVVVPDFTARRAAGEMFFNPLQITERTHNEYVSDVTITEGDLSAHYGNCGIEDVTGYSTAEVVSFITEPDINIEFLKSSSLLNAQASIDKSAYAYAEDLAEIHKTHRTMKALCGNASSVYMLFNARYEHYARFMRHSRAVARAWLETKYAIRPILISLYHLSDALERSRKANKPLRRRALGNAHASAVLYEHVRNCNANDRVNWVSTAKNVRECNVHTVLYYNKVRTESTFAESFGLRKSDVPKTLWALLPYSWCIDHFINVSKILDATVHLRDQGFTYIGGTQTIKVKTTSLRGTSSASTGPWYSQANIAGSWSGGSKEVVDYELNHSRIVLGEQEALTPALPMQLRLDWSFIGDLIALATLHVKI